MDPADLTYEKMISKLESALDSNIPLFNLNTSEDKNVNHYVALLTDFALVSDLVLSKKTNSDVSFSLMVFSLLAILEFNSDFCRSQTRNPMSKNLVADPNLLPDRKPRVFNLKGPENDLSSIGIGDLLPFPQLSDEYQKQAPPRCQFCGERRYHRDCPIKNVAARIIMKMVTKKASTENSLRAVQRGRTRTTRYHSLRRGRAMIYTGSDI
ncbi:unnamed protein product [Hymenolepis diminuta]|uniref:CCHC-type domain-containing protein n=2 Tax=Hymenolepis diminuta TaxID=6216 RepID=A0A0R3SDF6_HYMDI|nr:unnamed protein product [Hymenolepis diminuta]